jgi:hypothetical protein
MENFPRNANMKRSELKRATPLRASIAKVPKPAPGPRKVRCKVCKVQFLPDPVWAKHCSPDCGAELGLLLAAKKKAKDQRRERAETKAKLIELKPAKWALAKAKKAMNLYVRTIAEGKPCASCDTILVRVGRIGGDYDAGHFRSVGSAKHLEFDPRNVWGQCKHCNDVLKGNGQEYERRLRLKMGDDYVDGLLSDQEPRHYKKDDYLAIEAHYKQKLKEI